MSQLRSQSASQSEKSSAPCPNFLQQCRAMKSNQSFPTTVSHLLEMRDMKISELGRRAIQLGWQQSPKHLYRVVRGEVTVTPAHMELLARALDVQPEVFAEFRLWQVRRLFDPEQVGFKAAIEALKSWEGAGGVVAAPAEPHDAAELAADADLDADEAHAGQDRKSTRLNSSHVKNSYAVFCLKQ